MKRMLTLLSAAFLAGAMTMPIFAATPQMGQTSNPGQTSPYSGQKTHKKKHKKHKKGSQQPGQTGQGGTVGAGGTGSTTSPPPSR